MAIGYFFRFVAFLAVLPFWAYFVSPLTLFLTMMYFVVRLAFYMLVPVWCLLRVFAGVFANETEMAHDFVPAMQSIYSYYWPNVLEHCLNILFFGLVKAAEFVSEGYVAFD